MCGKNLNSNHSLNTVMGSPPHVREKHIQASLKNNVQRDHPRMCGKNFSKALGNSSSLGSPLHVREKHQQPTVSSKRIGITPACAEKTERQAIRKM